MPSTIDSLYTSFLPLHRLSLKLLAMYEGTLAIIILIIISSATVIPEFALSYLDWAPSSRGQCSTPLLR